MRHSIDQLEHALASTGKIVSGIRAEDWNRPSPCEGWTVRDVTNHLVGGLRIFTATIEGREPEGDHNSYDWLGDDPARSYVEAADADLAAWTSPRAMEISFDLSFAVVPGPMALVIHLTEVIVHGLDLAVASQQEDIADQELAAGLLATMQRMGIDAFRQPGIFGPEVAARSDDPPHRQLLAYLGRRLSEAESAGISAPQTVGTTGFEPATP